MNENMFAERFHAKRRAGLSEVRRDGSLTSAETDIRAGAAEAWAAEQFGMRANTEIFSNHGDKGIDFQIAGWDVDVVHLGVRPDGSPRTDGHLIINPNEPQRWSDIYLVVQGLPESGFAFAGWYFHEQLMKRPRQSFGYGEKLCCPVAKLNDIAVLMQFYRELGDRNR